MAANNQKKVSPLKTEGHSGTPVYGGYIVENETNAKLVGREKYKTYSNILANTSIIAAGIWYFLNVLSKPSWKVEAPSETSNDTLAEEYAEKLQEIMEGMHTPWHRVIRRAAMYRFHGFSIQEWTAKRREDGSLGLEDIAPRPQVTIERWDTNDHGKVLGVWQRSPKTQKEIYLPIEKIIYLVDDTLNDSPEGLGLFRSLVEPAQRLARYQQLEAFGFETDLRGIPVARIPYIMISKLVKSGEITEQEANDLIAPLETFVKKHIKNPELGITLDSQPYETSGADSTSISQVLQWDIDLLSGEGGNFEAVGKAIERLNHEIARVLGVEHLLLGQNTGTQALSKDKSDNFALIVDSTLMEIKETYERDFIQRIFELNGWDLDLKPSFKIDQIQYRDITDITTALRELALAGAPLDINDPAINEVRTLLGLMDAPEQEELDEDLTLSGAPKGKKQPLIEDEE